jgi:hypothetical protein
MEKMETTGRRTYGGSLFVYIEQTTCSIRDMGWIGRRSTESSLIQARCMSRTHRPRANSIPASMYIVNNTPYVCTPCYAVQKDEFCMHACKFFIQICKQTKLLRKWTLINVVNFVGIATVISSTLSLVKALRPRGRRSCELVLAGHDEIGGRSDQGGRCWP